jgi:hypothetical protein
VNRQRFRRRNGNSIQRYEATQLRLLCGTKEVAFADIDTVLAQ